jgi:HTH-type transcriptional regulator / antitoxin HipB
MIYSLKTPQEVSIDLAARLKQLRLIKKWKRSTLTHRSGVTESSLRRFEQTGKVSMENFLKLVHALGRLDEMDKLLQLADVRSLEDLKKNEMSVPMRGTI